MVSTYNRLKEAMKSPLVPKVKKYALLNPYKFKRTIIIDGHNLAHKALKAKFYAGMKTKSGKSTGHIYGSFSKLMAFLKVACFNPEIPCALVIVSDEYCEPRQKIMPSYKANRIKTSKEVQMINEALSLLYYFPHLLASIPTKDVEADDIIGAFITQNPQYEHWVLSSDRDLWQLWNKATFFEKHDRKFTDEDYKKTYDSTPPKMIPLFKAIFGDKSDEIPPIGGITKRKPVIKLFSKIKKPQHIFKTANIDKLPSSTAISIMDKGIMIKRGYKVAKLRTKSKILVEPHEFDYAGLKMLLIKYECNKHIEALNKFKSKMKG